MSADIGHTTSQVVAHCRACFVSNLADALKAFCSWGGADLTGRRATVIVENRLNQKKGISNVKKQSNEEPSSCGGYGPFCSSCCDSTKDQGTNSGTTNYVYFATGSHALTPEDQDHIRDVAAMMQRTPTFVATIVAAAPSMA